MSGRVNDSGQRKPVTYPQGMVELGEMDGDDGLDGTEVLLDANTSEDDDAVVGDDSEPMFSNQKDDQVVRSNPVSEVKETFGAVLNFINSILGAGIIGLPYAINECGFVMGIVMIILVSQMTSFSVILLVNAGRVSKKYEYEELCEHTIGKPGFYLVSVFMALFAYGAMVAYLIVLGDTITTIVEGVDVDTAVPILHERQFVIAMVAIFIILPLTLLKDMSKLSFSSGMSVVADVLLVFIVLAVAAPEFPTDAVADANGVSNGSTVVTAIAASTDAAEEDDIFTFANSNFFGGIGAISFAYTCHHSSFIVHNTLTPGKSRPRRWKIVAHVSLAVALFASLLLGIGGYVKFGFDTQADILNNFGCDDIAINVARGLLAVTMFFTYPMEQFVTRHSIHSIIWPGKGKVADHNVRYYPITILLWLSSLGISLAVSDLGIVLELTGAAGASMLGYILPVVVHFKTHTFRKLYQRAMGACNRSSPVYNDFNNCNERREAVCDFFVPLLIGAFGVVALLAGVISAVLAQVNSDGSESGLNCTAYFEAMGNVSGSV